MRSRWTILAALFVARATIAFQFQSVAAIAPQLSQGLGASLADIGVLIGLYFAPGALLALPGGAIGRRYGDKVVVLAGLLMMLVGELLMTTSTSWSVQIAGRLTAGIGGVLLNVLMTKMVADWFAGREIATAMAIFINSWPAGIAVALMLLPAIGATLGLHAVNLAVAGVILIGLGLIALVYRAPDAAVAVEGERSSLTADTICAVIAAGLIWCLYNIGFAMIFSFGPSMLVEQGWSGAAAGSTISIVLWLAALSVPLGGFLADRTRRGEVILVTGCIAFALLTLLLSRSGTVLPVVIALGILCGLPAGPIMSLPARVLEQKTRPIGMGIFYTVFYAGMLAGPAIGGKLSTSVGSASAALDFGAAVLLACPAVLWFFRRMVAGHHWQQADIRRA
ncbi:MULTISPECIES: CynX/NimT family MFS transporter [Bradyrhizobium]|jgi:predicted MFS family arabinose efflux permease|uniref:MFS family arabinose efflux permease n=2 Tax=Bradyrhizobium elkanii TaxID=29448 RepID=A0ABV4ESS5_BRAEL|nr:MFS transporter [Bradyrhizobium elkanii]MBP2429663.1 putative MFS family arabinose efflux permease [Bradyrhizobium elkanii]MCP1754910.1 putative MFS family arabinose efflux permease [Bradyrhizobium elkanii]MCP1980428.1 putative MFS family arabinose efflux permease [Bradyrhizobium elkanii]MCS3688579.1 putative MFS family arabinose efflux permease [Bradyrhizobium elkanii]MCS3884796.1 putative MFS family arabinose efflux permease [Bradyrhizobium elkanii]